MQESIPRLPNNSFIKPWREKYVYNSMVEKVKSMEAQLQKAS